MTRPRPHRHPQLAIVALVLAILGLTGCGGGPDGAVVASGDRNESPSASLNTPSEPASEPSFGELTVRKQDALLTGVLRTWQRALAEDLDPSSEHLQIEKRLGYERLTIGGVKPTPYDTVPSSLGLPKLGWRNAGESGTGMVQLTVFAEWSDAKYQMPCKFLETLCIPFEVDGARRAFHGSFSDHQGFGNGFFIAVERRDDTSIVLTVSSLFGNNTKIPVSGTGLTRDALVKAALDSRIALPQ
jgi:hypothetical protein